MAPNARDRRRSSRKKTRIQWILCFGSAAALFVLEAWGGVLLAAVDKTDGLLPRTPKDWLYTSARSDGPKIQPLKAYIHQLAANVSKIGAKCVEQSLHSFDTSYVVELRHCKFSHLDWDDFCDWAMPHWEKTVAGYNSTTYRDHSLEEIRNLNNNPPPPELMSGLLEIYVSHGRDNCDFGSYPLGLVPSELELLTPQWMMKRMEMLQLSSPVYDKKKYERLVFVVVAFQDPHHLRRLIDALWMPQHVVVVHLERTSPSLFREEVYDIARSHDNIIVLQFGAVIYETDSVSMINYRIMYWLVKQLQVEYDYHFTMGGAVYPLWSAAELATHMHGQERNVWMGELLQAGHSLTGAPQQGVLQRKRLHTTVPFKYTTQLYRRLPNAAYHGFDPDLPANVANLSSLMVYKTNSGNQAVFARSLVQKLVESPSVRHLFALAKYGCCCCLEERTWIGALGLINVSYQKEALAQSSIFQLWGGEGEECQGSMGNAILDSGEKQCYRIEDGTVKNWTVPVHVGDAKNKRSVYVKGEHMHTLLSEAKRQGFLFARKFRSDHAGSMELLDWVRTELHGRLMPDAAGSGPQT